MPNKYLEDLPSGITFGNGPFREVRLLVDGQVAGVVFPYVDLRRASMQNNDVNVALGIWSCSRVALHQLCGDR